MRLTPAEMKSISLKIADKQIPLFQETQFIANSFQRTFLIATSSRNLIIPNLQRKSWTNLLVHV